MKNKDGYLNITKFVADKICTCWINSSTSLLIYPAVFIKIRSMLLKGNDGTVG